MSTDTDIAPRRRGALVFIFVTVSLDMIAFGVIAPVFVPLVEKLMHGDVRHAAGVVGAFGTVFALMQFGWMPFLGVLSDRIGRRPVIVLSNLGLALDYVVMALAPNLIWLLIGRVVSGITAANATAANAYVADVTPPEKRAGAFGMIGAAFGVGFVLGPALGGLCGQFDPRLPFWVAGGLSLLNGLYGALVLPESLPREKRAARFAWAKANPVGSLRLLRRHRELTVIALVLFGSSLAGMVMQSTWVLYVTYRYHWQPGMTGISLAVLGVISGVAQVIVVPRFVKRFGERVSLFAGIAFGTFGLVACGLAASGWWFFPGLVGLCLWSLAFAAGQAIMTRHVSPQEQGELQGAVGSIRGLASLLGPGIFTSAFAIGIAHDLPGAAWYLGAVLLVVTVLPVLRQSFDGETVETPAADAALTVAS